MALSEFSLQYVPQKAVKGQALADFLAQHPSPYDFGDNNVEIGMVATCDNYWTMYFDGSSTSSSAGVGIVIQSPAHDRWYFSLKLDFDCTNNQAEYEALVIGLGVLHDLRAICVLIFGDSELVINQLNGSFRCMSCTLAPDHMVASYLAESFDGITFEHIYLRLCVNLGRVLQRLPLPHLRPYIPILSCLRHVNPCLIRRLHLHFLPQVTKILMPRHIHQLLDLCIINQKPKLIEFQLNLLKHLLLKLFCPPKHLLHGHRGCKNTSLAVNDPLNKLFHVARELVVAGNELGVLVETFDVVDAWADGEDGGQHEGELFGAHGLDFEAIVDGGYVEDYEGLAGENPCLLCKLYVIDSDPGDHQIL